MPFVVPLRKKSRYHRGDVLLDDQYSRLYVVLKSWWSPKYAQQYKALIVADWSVGLENPNFPGQIVQFGPAVEEDVLVGHVELPANM